jgi:hypothetical protein
MLCVRAAAALSACLVLAAGAAACSGSDDDDASTPATATSTTTAADAAYPLDDTLRLNDIQVLGSHNSYHVQADPAIFAALQGFAPDVASTLEYSHPPLDEQFDAEGIRQIELDVWPDPDGGRYAHPKGPEIVNEAFTPDPAMLEPGLKVFHVQDIDFRSTCPTFVACLTVVRDWSQAHPGHVPIMIEVEVKADPVPAPASLGFVVPPPITADDLDTIDTEIRSVFDDDELLTPDDVRGDADSLEDVVTTDGWPTLGEVRGQVLFTLDNEGELRDLYVEGHPGLRDRVLFTSSPRGTPEAGFLKLNDPIGDADEIRQAVADGYVVRTRADADTVQARSGDTSMRDAALASGAQWVSTDYPVDDARFAPDYSVSMPGGTPARCNPVREPDGCTPTDVEDPDALGGPAGG